MIKLGSVDVGFNIQPMSIDVCLDKSTKQQVLSLNFSLQLPLPQLLRQLLLFQSSDGKPPIMGSVHEGDNGTQPGEQVVSDIMALTSNALQQHIDRTTARPPSLDHGGVNEGAVAAPPGVQPPGPQRMMQSLRSPPQAQPGANAPAGGQDRDGAGERAKPRSTAQEVQPVQRQAAVSMLPDMSMPPSNNQLVQALIEGSVAKIKSALQRVDVNATEPAPRFRTALHQALEMGCGVDVLHTLLEARANANQAMAKGKTPLHLAIEDYSKFPSIVNRMLLCARADINIPDADGITPLDIAKSFARHSSSGSITACHWVRQLLNEITESPSIAIGVVGETNEVRTVLFADMEHDKLVYNTDSTVGLYSLKSKRLIYQKKLRQLQATVTTTVQHLSVNPVLGTIAICLEIAGAKQDFQNLSIIWPNGQLQDEEPLKLSMAVGQTEGHDPDALPACVSLSRSKGPQLLLCRSSDGQVYCWRLNVARSQLMDEEKLMSRGGMLATSDNGWWIAVVNKDTDHVDVWSYQTKSGLAQMPKFVFSWDKRPLALALMSRGRDQYTESGQACLLAAAEGQQGGHDGLAVELCLLNTEGVLNVLCRVQHSAPCHTLSFCHQGNNGARLLSAYIDGCITFYGLGGELCTSYDSPQTRSVGLSPDGTLIVSTEANYFRVYRAPMPETA